MGSCRKPAPGLTRGLRGSHSPPYRSRCAETAFLTSLFASKCPSETNLMDIPLTWNFPSAPPAPTLVLTHGAGASSTHPNTTALAELLAERGIRVARFDFPYMRRAIAEGRRPWPPDPEDVLAGTWVQVIQQLAEQGVPTSKLFFGGRSMGGRIASYIADAIEPAGMVCISYPFHAPKDPSTAITIHLQQLATPTLIVQGERDEYGTREEVEAYDLSHQVELCWIPDGNHGLIPRKRSGHTEEGNRELAATAIADFAKSLS